MSKTLYKIYDCQVLATLSLLFCVVQSSTDLTYKIEEELPLLSEVGSVARDSGISRVLSSSEFNTLRYWLLLYPESHTNLFSISNTTGILRTTSRIDRETECHYETSCTLNLHVAAQTESGRQFFTFTVAIIVLDINDNSPVFQPSSTVVTIDEDAALYSSIPIPPASDIDILNNTLQRYHLKSSSEVFELKVTRNLDGSLIPQLYVKSEMDRERQPFYFVTVVALDGGNPRRSGELKINVTVNDVNDNAPLFTQQTYDVEVKEITPANSKVMTLLATDPDTGQNGRVSYRLGPRQSEEAFNTFRVERETGNIVTLLDLTPMQGKTMRLVVEAIDHGVKSLTAQAEVHIHILDSVNNAPQIRMTTTPASRVFHVMENTPPGYVVTHFVVEDNDSGENGMVTCHLQDDNFSLQRLKTKEYKVSVYGPLDREKVQFYDITVTCSDGGKPSKTSNVAFTVVLDDDNDNPPRFAREVYRANVTENFKDELVVRLHADDDDLGRNAQVQYALSNVTSLVSTYIQVNATSGEIRTRKGLDHELFTRLDFHVLAIDAGKRPMTSTARVIIDVRDLNDNMPQVPSGYFLSVMENSPIGTLVGRIQAIDRDLGPAGEIGYSLLTDNGGTRLFNLTHDGDVRTLRKFDREMLNVYDISVLARDFDPNPQTNILQIRIKITDDNDHRPVIDFPREGNRTAYVSVGVKTNTTITRVVASDADEGENATLLYSLVNGGKDLFEMDTRSGRVFTLRRVEGRDKGHYRIRVFVRDAGPYPLSESADLVLVVTQGDSEAAAGAFNRSSHIVIVAILIGVTIFIAIIVFLIVLRFLRKDRRRDQRPKYTGGLPMAVKSRSASPDEVSCDEGLWRRYDEAKRCNGPGVRSSDVTYDANDDIIMFKLKLADQYRELEPEDKDPANSSLPRDNTSCSNRTSVMSDLDGAPDVVRDRTTRLATFQVKSTPLHGSQSPNMEKKLRAAKMNEESSASGTKDLCGTDSGRGTSDDGSQGRSSFTDDSGCPVSPNHSGYRGTTPRHQGTYARPTSGSTYDRPPLLMTFQSNSGDQANVSTLPSRRDFSYSPSPRLLSDKDITKVKVGEDADIIVHRGKRDAGIDKSLLKNDDPNSTSPKTIAVNGDLPNKTLNSSSPKSPRRGNGVVRESPYAATKGSPLSRDIRLCSEPPMPSKEESKLYSSPCTTRGVQETGFPSLSPYTNKNGVIPSSGKKPLFLGTAERSRLKNEANLNNSPFKSGSSTFPSSSDNKLTSCPQLYKDVSGSQLGQQSLPSKSFNSHDSALSLPFRSSRDLLNESVETQDDGNTTTTSGSYTIDHDDLILDLPHTDVYV